MNVSQSSRIKEFKIQASIFLKDLRSSDQARARKALTRLQKISPFNQWSLEKILSNLSEIKRKHALELIAFEQGHPSWRALVQIENQLADDHTEINFRYGGFLHVWFASLEEAKTYVEREGGYLLGYRNHYFVAQAEYITLLGLDPFDPNWPVLGRGRSCLKIKLR